MPAPPPASELERRKKLRIVLRPDLDIEEHRYEGRKFYVVKDPVSLRYYRLKDNERFLLKYMDGKRTLEEAQKAYEREYRPERLKLEDLESFAQQLIQAGLALNDSPRAGKQLYEQKSKRTRREWMQTLTNILYIKIPVFDPERVLTAMLGWLGFIFTWWFFLFSLVVMGAAILLITVHFDTFYRKLPDYHEFFSFKTVVYLYISLAVVKVIHEFGHGLSCKRFGGEVHEMGFLLMCFSPALYCNVSDAWVLPSKWHRIIISAAGIYVELIIAAIATFVWWYTPTQPFINNLALSLMVVCSVSTVVFNANPLMRFDGYYVLADWLEIPNLREKANRYLSNLFSQVCLGIEVPPEEYMATGRKVLFISYAIVSYIYRWVVTFGILILFQSFLKPYKLEILGNILTLAAIGSMTIWPAYNMGKNIYKRGRLPDMKRNRVLITTAVGVVILLFLFLVPVPISRVRGLALVQSDPAFSSAVSPRRAALLAESRFRAGDTVREGEVLATFTNPDLAKQLAEAETKLETSVSQVRFLESQLSTSNDETEKNRLKSQLTEARGEEIKARTERDTLKKREEEDLVLLSPRGGVIGQAPRRDDLGKLVEGALDQPNTTPLFTIHEPGKLRLCMPLETSEYNQLRASYEPTRMGKRPPLDVVIRIHGHGNRTWKGTIVRLEESEAKFVPPMLSSRSGGPVAVKAPTAKSPGLVPQAQHFLVYIDIDNDDDTIVVNSMAQVKIYLQPETCAWWVWRKLNDLLNLRLM